MLNRRRFLHAVALGGAGFSLPLRAAPDSRAQPSQSPFVGLREKYRHDLFERFIPFWEKHGVDREHGGFMCSLDHDGTRVSTDKHHWFQGRGIWVWSYLYNHFGQNPSHLAVAAHTRSFLKKHAPHGVNWPELWSREGGVVKPFSGDIFGALFAAEGFHEYFLAAHDEAARDDAYQLFFQVCDALHRPDFRFFGEKPGVRGLSQWFLPVQVGTQLLQHEDDSKVRSIVDRAVEAIMTRHHDAELDLTMEFRNSDFTPAAGHEKKCLLGHAIEALWIVMAEARRRRDITLQHECIRRLHRHFKVAWDEVYGGLSEWINVGADCYEWPEDRPTGTSLSFHFRGEFNRLKSMWALDEAIIGFMLAYESQPDPVTASLFEKARAHIEAKHSLAPHGYLPWLPFLDRQGTFQARGSRQDNYHHARQLMYGLQFFDRMELM